MTEKSFPLGVIEGFYGKPWTWEERENCISFLQENRFDFYRAMERFLEEHLQK